MKHFFLTAALIVAAITLSFAGEPPTKAENDAAMKTGHTLLAAETANLEMKVKNHDAKGTESAVREVLTLMRKGMAQTNVEIKFETIEQQKSTILHYNKMEMTAYEYTLLSKNVAVNSQQLIEHANTFLKLY